MQQRQRILFGLKEDWEKGLRFGADPQRFEIVMADLAKADTSGFVGVVPLNLGDHDWLASTGRHLPAVLVPKHIRELCHDKLMLNRLLIDLGFGDHIPRLRDRLPDNLAQNPVIIKARKGAWGQGTDLLLTAPVPGKITERLAAGTHFIQDFIPGHLEYATHVLMHRGAVQMLETREYDMGDVPRVKGVGQLPLKSRWLGQTPWQDVLLRMLAAIGFHDGTCCINYRVADGSALLFEINPRFGGSLVSNLTLYLDRYLACVGGTVPPSGRYRSAV